jgi:adenine-specific DNA-methyltransferase
MTSPNLTEENIDKIAKLFPTVITETLSADGNPQRTIDFDLLRQELSDHIVEGPQERYRLDWPGKRAAAFTANAPIAKTLRPNREESVNFDTTKNLFIEGDNLDSLKLLQKSYLGKVKLIYIDPPYNTGNDFVYDDEFAESTAEYLQRSGQMSASGERLVANTESNGKFHSDWLSMIYPRLRLARNLLTEDGIIFISIDDGEHSDLVGIVKEIFGTRNYIASVARVTKKTSNKGTHFAPSKDYIVAVARNVDALHPLMDSVSDEYRKKFSGVDARGHFATVGLYQASLDPLRGCVNQRYWIEAPDGTFLLPPGPNRPNSVTDASNRPPESREDRVWRWSFDSYLAKKSLLVFKETSSSPLQDQNGQQSRWNVYTKYYLEDRLGDGIRPRDFLDTVTNDQGTKALSKLGLGGIFDFAKPPQLVSKFLTWIDDPQAVVLDFFAGSGTTGQAVLDQNELDGGTRKFVCIQLDEECPEGSAARDSGFISIAAVARERIRRAAQAIRDRGSFNASAIDLGFRALSVDTTNIIDNLRTPDVTLQSELETFRSSVKSDRSDEDLLFQILLDWGLELSLPISLVDMAGCKVFSVDDDALLACFASDISGDAIHEMARRKPLRAVFRDDCFESDAARINAEQIFREVSPSTEVKAI